METFIDEYPWTALIEYERSDSEKRQFLCQGALINERYVVVPAHCLKLSLKIKSVRLGEWRLSSDVDCENGFCSDAPVDITIEKAIVHSNYSVRLRHYDIGLIRLNETVKFSDTIRPVCLPQPGIKFSEQPSQTMYVGFNAKNDDTSNMIKSSFNAPIESLEECGLLYKQLGITLQPSEICAKVENPNYYCRGNSGSSLVQSVDGIWYLRGIIVFGHTSCFREISEVYTNISTYVDWIRDNVEAIQL